MQTLKREQFTQAGEARRSGVLKGIAKVFKWLKGRSLSGRSERGERAGMADDDLGVSRSMKDCNLTVTGGQRGGVRERRSGARGEEY